MNNVKFLHMGDSALTIVFSDTISDEINAKIHKICLAIEKLNVKGVIETLPTISAISVYFNPIEISFYKLKKILLSIIKNQEEEKTQSKRVFLIPVCYDDEFALDMDSVLELTKLSKSELIKIHTGQDYLIHMLGFLPGFAYLGGIDKRIACKRLETPRTIIPKGSVGIGGNQTGIYPMESPGGWRIIGKTPVTLYDPNSEIPVAYKAGDYIRFFEITKDEFYSGEFNKIKVEEMQ